MWIAPAAFFALLALLSALSPVAPGRWLDSLLHVFGIGAVSARSTAFSLWLVASLVAAGAGFALSQLSQLEPPFVALDAAAIGLAAALLLLWLASRGNARGTGLGD
jgi:hypothetical protein